jgi:hypothetical protein
MVTDGKQWSLFMIAVQKPFPARQQLSRPRVQHGIGPQLNLDQIKTQNRLSAVRKPPIRGASNSTLRSIADFPPGEERP